MSNSTFATVIIAAEDQEAAQADLPGNFTSAYTTDPTGAPPATNYVSSGWWLDTELDFIVNEAVWQKKVKFGDAQAALDAMGLVAVVPETDTLDTPTAA